MEVSVWVVFASAFIGLLLGTWAGWGAGIERGREIAKREQKDRESAGGWSRMPTTWR